MNEESYLSPERHSAHRCLAPAVVVATTLVAMMDVSTVTLKLFE